MRDLSGRTAFITGGSRGIGLAIATSLADRGATVAIADIDEASLSAAVSTLSARTTARGFVLDVTDLDAFTRVADEAEQALGPVSILVNNAGIIDSISPARMDPGLWRHIMSVNLDGVFNGHAVFVPRMIRRGTGAHIVNTASGAGLIESGSGFAYHASKFAVVGLSESLRAELARFGIGVTVLCPGAVATNIVENTKGVRPASAPQHTERTAEILAVAQRYLLEHGTRPEDVGEMVVEAIEADRPYILTDSSFVGAIRARAEALADSTPEAVAGGGGAGAPAVTAALPIGETR